MKHVRVRFSLLHVGLWIGIAACHDGSSGFGTAATLVSIDVTPTNPTIATGTTQQLSGTGTYTDGSTQDLTAQVTWASSDVAVATVSNAAGSNGLATGVGAGSATLSANLSGTTGTMALTVKVVPAFRTPPGGPLPGLTADELAAFERGKAVFTRRFRPSEGLGPQYNATSCESCHSVPTVGGSAPLYRNFYLAMLNSGPLQTPLQGQTSAVMQAFGAGTSFTLQEGRALIEAEPGTPPPVVAQRNALPLFGTGLFEFVTDSTIISHADPEDLDGDGISGRHNTDNGAIGRLGVKAQSNNIELFTRAPLKNQLGVTSDPFLGSNGIVSLGHALLRHRPAASQVSTDPNGATRDFDGVPDPEIGRDDLGDLIAFSRFLAPPEPLLPFSAAATRGEALFDQTGCTKCHLPELPSSRGPVRAFTDLLLHEMGPELADNLGFGRPQFSSLSRPDSRLEFRTQPLWGVSLSAPFLHDGRAETLRDAVELHGGEATAIRDAFLALPATSQDDLIAFLEHL